MPILGVTRLILEDEEASMRGVEDFFSVARTMPLVALMPREVTPWFTAARAYSGGSICEWVGWVGGLVGRVEDTYLDEFAAGIVLAVCRTYARWQRQYLGEKVVREKE